MTTKGSNNPFPSVLLNEVATDGSDTPTPAADYRRLFLGEDGELHLIDSADVVTDVTGTGLTDPMTTRGDIIVRNAANATARLAVGTAGQYLKSDGTDVAWATPGSFTTWTPALTASTTNPTLGSGSSATGRYTQIGKLTVATGIIAFGTSGTNAGSGTYQLSVPANVRVTELLFTRGYGKLYDSSTGNERVIELVAVAASGPDTGLNRMFVIDGSAYVTHAAPWAWAASDQMEFTLIYEAA